MLPLVQTGGGSGGSTAPGGSSGNIQYNNSGAFGGFADGTSHQILHGGKTFSAVDLTSEVTGVLPVANGGVPVLATADQGFFISNGLLQNHGVAGNVALVANAQEVRAVQFVLPFAMTISRVTVSIAALVAASTVTMGIYSADKLTKLIDSGKFNGASASVQTLTITPVTLTPGVYWFAQSASTQTTLTAVRAYTSNANILSMINNQTNKKMGLAANPAVSGVLPSALGAITSLSYDVIAAVFEP